MLGGLSFSDFVEDGATVARAGWWWPGAEQGGAEVAMEVKVQRWKEEG